jgi:hypothetical protein
MLFNRGQIILSAWQCERNHGRKEFFIIVNCLLTMTFPPQFAAKPDAGMRPGCGDGRVVRKPRRYRLRGG